MLFIDCTLPTVAANLAVEDAILELAEQGAWQAEYLRVWRAEKDFGVIGRGSKYAQEVNVSACDEAGIPVFRRISGGAAIVAGPGCLLYAVMLSLKMRPQLAMVDIAHDFVMQQMVAALRPLAAGLTYAGTCDLVLNGRKVSGNSLRVRRDWLLYHGTLLLDMDLQKIDRYLNHPPREPEYRQHRRHHEFVDNLGCSEMDATARLKEQWQATAREVTLPLAMTEELVQQKYTQDSWNKQR
jgi:lipoate-protein ligase A